MARQEQDLAAALVDTDALEARVHFAKTAAAAIRAVGDDLRNVARERANEFAAALALAAAAGAELARGTCVLLEVDNAYAAAALLRQVVEVEYLLWTFGDDVDDGARWLRADRKELLDRFSPSAMRKRSKGTFRSKEYGMHCATGGHPTPSGASTLLAWRPAVPALWADLGQHLEHVWNLLVRASAVVRAPDVIDPQVDTVFDALQSWRVRDPWACREPFSTE